MAQETDLRTLSCINIEKRLFDHVVVSDGSGAYFFDEERQTFVFVIFETEEQTVLTLEKFKNIKGRFFTGSIKIFDKYEFDLKSTIFIGFVREGQSCKLFLVLFSVSSRSKTVSVIDELDTNWIYSRYEVVPVYI